MFLALLKYKLHIHVFNSSEIRGSYTLSICVCDSFRFVSNGAIHKSLQTQRLGVNGP